MTANGSMIIRSIIHNEIEGQEIAPPPFNEHITRKVREAKIIAASDASVKSGSIVGYWIVADVERENTLSKELYHKLWTQNTSILAEALALLQLINVIERK